MNRITHLFSLLCLMLVPGAACAHVEALSVYGGFPQGFFHPVFGLDHLLAMICVGVVSAQIGGKAVWGVPLTFVLAMVLGGVAAMNSPIEILYEIIILIETGIAASVLLLGGAIALKKNITTFVVMIFVAVFGVFHGSAHGMEIPDLVVSQEYIAGFVTASALLHILGVGIGYISARFKNGPTVLRYIGAVVAGMGLHILLLIAGF